MNSFGSNLIGAMVSVAGVRGRIVLVGQSPSKMGLLSHIFVVAILAADGSVSVRFLSDVVFDMTKEES